MAKAPVQITLTMPQERAAQVLDALAHGAQLIEDAARSTDASEAGDYRATAGTLAWLRAQLDEALPKPPVLTRIIENTDTRRQHALNAEGKPLCEASQTRPTGWSYPKDVRPGDINATVSSPYFCSHCRSLLGLGHLKPDSHGYRLSRGYGLRRRLR